MLTELILEVCLIKNSVMYSECIVSLFYSTHSNYLDFWIQNFTEINGVRISTNTRFGKPLKRFFPFRCLLRFLNVLPHS